MAEQNCVFCEIIKGNLEASIVYENQAIVAFMDQRQANPGHVLVVPKAHFPNIYGLSAEAGAAIMEGLRLLAPAVKRAFNAEGLSIWQSNGAAAGQEVDHVHFHIHPRKIGDDLLRVYATKPAHPDRPTLLTYAKNIQYYL